MTARAVRRRTVEINYHTRQNSAYRFGHTNSGRSSERPFFHRACFPAAHCWKSTIKNRSTSHRKPFQRITARILPSPYRWWEELQIRKWLSVAGGEKSVSPTDTRQTTVSPLLTCQALWNDRLWIEIMKKTENLAIPHGNHCENYTILQCRNWLVSIEILKQTKK